MSCEQTRLSESYARSRRTPADKRAFFLSNIPHPPTIIRTITLLYANFFNRLSLINRGLLLHKHLPLYANILCPLCIFLLLIFQHIHWLRKTRFSRWIFFNEKCLAYILTLGLKTSEPKTSKNLIITQIVDQRLSARRARHFCGHFDVQFTA